MAWHWGNLMDLFLGGNWMCAWVITLRFPARKYGVLFGWKITNGPRLSDLNGA